MKTLFKNFNLIDGTGKELQASMDMVVDSGKIVELGQKISGQYDQTVDLEGKYVIPGLMDTHIHVSCGVNSSLAVIEKYNTVDKTAAAIINLQMLLEQGVTFIRDVGSFDTMTPEIHLKKFIQQGYLKGPHIYSAGNMITMTGGHASHPALGGYIADGVEECKRAARSMIAKGADLVKSVTTGGVGTEGNDVNAYQYNVDELTAIVTEAHKAGRKVAVHSHGAQGIKNGILAGVDSIEHATLVDDEGIEMLVENGTYIVPTFAIQKMIATGNNSPKFVIEKQKLISGDHKKNFKKCYEAGVKIACGTDTVPTFMEYPVANELALMIEASGMSNMEALQCATKNAADLIGVLDEYGTLECNKYADFVVLDENPLEDITALQRVNRVYKTGAEV